VEQPQTSIENEIDSEDSEKEQQVNRTNCNQDPPTVQQNELNENTTDKTDQEFEPHRSKSKKQLTEEVIREFQP
jgi:hypothetical protein